MQYTYADALENHPILIYRVAFFLIGMIAWRVAHYTLEIRSFWALLGIFLVVLFLGRIFRRLIAFFAWRRKIKLLSEIKSSAKPG
jgi:hypothetical protein